jgi:hypothetical protein
MLRSESAVISPAKKGHEFVDKRPALDSVENGEFSYRFMKRHKTGADEMSLSTIAPIVPSARDRLVRWSFCRIEFARAQERRPESGDEMRS